MTLLAEAPGSNNNALRPSPNRTFSSIRTNQNPHPSTPIHQATRASDSSRAVWTDRE